MNSIELLAKEETLPEQQTGPDALDVEMERPLEVGPVQEASTSGQDTQQLMPLGRLPMSLHRYNLMELTHLGEGSAVRQQLDLLQARLRQGAAIFQPTICKPRSTTIGEVEYLQEMGLCVPDWRSHKPTRKAHMHYHAALRGPVRTKAVPQQHTISGKVGNAIKLLRAVKSKANGSGRTYTSRYRGVHQTFPTKRWEAQFRRNGKPTSLGCFDNEEEAARAYDKMMLWCELHNAAGVKSGITNFDATEYEKEFAWLQTISQDELIEALRSEGRRQAAHRMMRAKREGQVELATEDFEETQQQNNQQQQHQSLATLGPSLSGLIAVKQQPLEAQEQQEQSAASVPIAAATGVGGPVGLTALGVSPAAVQAAMQAAAVAAAAMSSAVSAATHRTELGDEAPPGLATSGAAAAAEAPAEADVQQAPVTMMVVDTDDGAGLVSGTGAEADGAEGEGGPGGGGGGLGGISDGGEGGAVPIDDESGVDAAPSLMLTTEEFLLDS